VPLYVICTFYSLFCFLSSGDLSDKDFTVPNILQTIIEVKFWKELGLQLGLKSPKLNTIEQEEDTEESRKIKMIKEWMKLGDEKASWDILQKALAAPALCENSVAQSLAKRRGSSFDSKSVRCSQSTASTNSGSISVPEYSEEPNINYFFSFLQMGNSQRQKFEMRSNIFIMIY